VCSCCQAERNKNKPTFFVGKQTPHTRPFSPAQKAFFSFFFRPFPHILCCGVRAHLVLLFFCVRFSSMPEWWTRSPFEQKRSRRIPPLPLCCFFFSVSQRPIKNKQERRRKKPETLSLPIFSRGFFLRGEKRRNESKKGSSPASGERRKLPLVSGPTNPCPMDVDTETASTTVLKPDLGE